MFPQKHVQTGKVRLKKGKMGLTPAYDDEEREVIAERLRQLGYLK